MSGIDPSKAGSPNPGQHQSMSHQQLSAASSLQQFNSVLAPSNSVTSMLDHYRLSQLYQYALAADRLRCPLPTSTASSQGTNPAAAFHHNAMSAFRPEMAAAAVAAVPLLYNNPYYRLDPRLALYRPPEEPKPQHSYIGLIAMAILSSVDKKLVLSDIYQYILDNYAYFRSRGPGWRNSIRHNLSLNDCFVKAGRSANGKGHYWAIHPANIDDFTKGDFRRRKAQRKVRRHMGLAVDDEDSPSPPPSSPPLSILRPTPDVLGWQEHHPNFMRQSITQHLGFGNLGLGHLAPQGMPDISPFANNIPVGFNKYMTSNSNISEFPLARGGVSDHIPRNTSATTFPAIKSLGRKGKRQFDVASLLAPEMKEALQQVSPSSGNGEHIECESNDNGSNSPGEKMYESKFGSSSSSLFQAHSDDGDDDDQRDEDHEKLNTREKLNASACSPSKSPSPKLLNVTTDGEDPPTPNTSDGKSSRAGHVHARRLAQRRHFHSRRVSGAVSDSFNNNKEQSTTNCNSRRLISLNENHHSEGNPRGFGNDFPYTAPPGMSSNRSQPNANELFFQQNPSLASLVILSSRYRELTSSLQQQFTTNSNRRDQK